MQSRQAVLVIAALTLLAACAGSPAASAPSSLAPASEPRTTAPPTAPTSIAARASALAPLPSATAGGVPICTAAALQQSANAGRSLDDQLTVNDADVHCQDAWAVVGANDLVNRAQYTFVFQWADGQWQRIPDRTTACAGQQIPAQLYDLACHSN